MKIAVLSLCRDRLRYTMHCFDRLHDLAGCEFDHYVYDNGSTDGTREWLRSEPDLTYFLGSSNVGISHAMNWLLDVIEDDYDVVVKFDNDCELTQMDTLRDVCELALEGDALLSPRILGLNNPPASQGTFWIGDEEIVDIPQIGGIFIAVPAWVYEKFRYSTNVPLHGPEDVEICWWFRGQGGRCGYVQRLTANHYETTSGQHARYPAYFERTLAEGKPAL